MRLLGLLVSESDYGEMLGKGKFIMINTRQPYRETAMTYASSCRTGFAALMLTTMTSALALAQAPPGVLVVGQIAEPKSLDPHAVTAGQ